MTDDQLDASVRAWTGAVHDGMRQKREAQAAINKATENRDAAVAERVRRADERRYGTAAPAVS